MLETDANSIAVPLSKRLAQRFNRPMYIVLDESVKSTTEGQVHNGDSHRHQWVQIESAIFSTLEQVLGGSTIITSSSAAAVST
ncbi:hypothetical protein EV182_004598 [Spiromyces aspiralis]|uniref:Uncharacterized protein n=1 Tax=Spiromyces aspiralis TaxID=68401 RepID=A0ACC1HWC6_9FUNG|nr:hypothetical protein EV182_004598 [Spiromyces aspiralis]